MRKFLGKIFGTIELFTKVVIEYEWDQNMRQMLKKAGPYEYPAYINIVKRQKAVRLIMGQEYEFMINARASNSFSEIHNANSYVLDHPTEFYNIIDYGKEKGNEVFITNDPYGYGGTRKFLVLGETITMFYDFDESEQHYKKSKSFVA